MIIQANLHAVIHRLASCDVNPGPDGTGLSGLYYGRGKGVTHHETNFTFHLAVPCSWSLILLSDRYEKQCVPQINSRCHVTGAMKTSSSKNHVWYGEQSGFELVEVCPGSVRFLQGSDSSSIIEFLVSKLAPARKLGKGWELYWGD